jgi:hypothetical protein
MTALPSANPPENLPAQITRQRQLLVLSHSRNFSGRNGDFSFQFRTLLRVHVLRVETMAMALAFRAGLTGFRT